MNPHESLSSSHCIQQCVNLKLLATSPVGFALGGQIAKGGSDILEECASATDRLHMFTWRIEGTYERKPDGQEIDSTGHTNYKPVGHEALPTGEIFDISLEGNFGGWINVELDGTHQHAPKLSQRAIGTLERCSAIAFLGE